MKKKSTYKLPTTRIHKLEQIISGYYRVRHKGGVTSGQLRDFSKASPTSKAMLSLQDVSGSIHFLEDLGILDDDLKPNTHRLTDFGIAFGKYLIKHPIDKSTYWEAAVRKSDFVMDILETLRDGLLYPDDLVREIVTKAGRDYDSGPARYGATSIIGILKKAGLVHESKAEGRRQVALSPPKAAPPFISIERINTLLVLESPRFDLHKLIELCREINLNYEHKCYYAVGMLVRALLDHLPPLFDSKKDFSEVIAGYGNRAFKENARVLDEQARKIFDRYLHEPIDRRVAKVNSKQVNFAANLDVFLGDVINKVQSLDAPPR